MSDYTRIMRALATLLLAGILLTQAFIDLELSLDLGPWHLNAPLADLLALALIPVGLLLARGRPGPLPGAAGYALFLLACALSTRYALDPHESLHHLLRKPIFMYVAYAVCLPVAAREARPERVAAGLLAGAGLTALVSLISSALRIAAGDTLWFQTLSGLTPNHKTLAVALAGQMPLIIGLHRIFPGLSPRLLALRRAALAGCVLAVLASASKTSWITMGLGFAWFFPAHRPLGTRPRLLAPLLLAGFALALYAPLLLGSRAMLDAARSRHSVNVRDWEMFARHPLLGSGTGMNVEEVMVTFPHYRVNGVDAHGVIQKVASETGLLGLAGYLGFAGATFWSLRRRAREQPGTEGPPWALLGAFMTLTANLLLSTETFSPTHWVPFGLMWGLHLSSSRARAP